MEWILFFDGDCGFCSAAVRWIARCDKRARVCFAPLQGELARAAGMSHYAGKDDGTMVLLRQSDGKHFVRSDAVIELARALGGLWRGFAIAGFIPKTIRDALYRWVARNRFRIFGKADVCALPDPELRKRLRL